jgi:hypothetical protein
MRVQAMPCNYATGELIYLIPMDNREDVPTPTMNLRVVYACMRQTLDADPQVTQIATELSTGAIIEISDQITPIENPTGRDREQAIISTGNKFLAYFIEPPAITSVESSSF